MKRSILLLALTFSLTSCTAIESLFTPYCNEATPCMERDRMPRHRHVYDNSGLCTFRDKDGRRCWKWRK